ncbi:MAG: YsnF/AvaK domain-containing protein [Candidatus Dasytiphilus stammeri]
MSYEKIVTLFDNFQHAQDAKRNLLKAGFKKHDISLINNDQLQGGANILVHRHDIWRRLLGQSLTDQEAKIYGQAVKTGGVVLTLRTKEEDTPRAISILNTHPLVEMSNDTVSNCNNEDIISEKNHSHLSKDKKTAEEEVLELAEEKLEIGKKVVYEGSTRVRRFVTQKDVEVEIPLHEEHASILRRALKSGNCPQSADNIDWSETVVEISDTHEQPVINKKAKVVEEVIVRKEGKDRVEKIRDTLRKQEIEVKHNDKCTK